LKGNQLLNLSTNILKIPNMKNRKELDVDFIGGQGPMTKEEEKAISDYFKSQKQKKRRLAFKKVSPLKSLVAP